MVLRDDGGPNRLYVRLEVPLMSNNNNYNKDRIGGSQKRLYFAGASPRGKSAKIRENPRI